MKRIEFLYFESCPSYKQALANLKAALAALKMEAEIRMVNVDTPEKAEKIGFLGSPTIVVDGVDLEGRTGGFAFNCRMYDEDGNLTGIPPKRLILDCLAGLGEKRSTGDGADSKKLPHL